jgi:hypothetical protein
MGGAQRYPSFRPFGKSAPVIPYRCPIQGNDSDFTMRSDEKNEKP